MAAPSSLQLWGRGIRFEKMARHGESGPWGYSAKGNAELWEKEGMPKSGRIPMKKFRGGGKKRANAEISSIGTRRRLIGTRGGKSETLRRGKRNAMGGWKSKDVL